VRGMAFPMTHNAMLSGAGKHRWQRNLPPVLLTPGY
jgi:hypothetical protein